MSPDDQKDATNSTVELTSKLAGHYNENNELQLGLIDKLISAPLLTTKIPPPTRTTTAAIFSSIIGWMKRLRKLPVSLRRRGRI